MKGTLPLRVICVYFFLWPVCQGWCQQPPPSKSLQELRIEGSNFGEIERQKAESWSALPDAPSSVSSSTQEVNFHMYVDEVSVGQPRETRLRQLTPGSECCPLARYYQVLLVHPERIPFLERYLYPSARVLGPRYRPSTSGSLMGRASYAASRIFVMRDNFGRARLNTPYLLGLLTSLAAHPASPPNFARSTLAIFNSFGSTAGGDAGMNVFHEFGPSIRQIVKGHTPKLVSRVEARFRGK